MVSKQCLMKWSNLMVIKQIKMKNFGKFYNKTIEFSPGINLIYGENESGKTTIFHFIKSMLFGIERQRGRAAQFDQYHLYEPWENPMYFEGELKFLAGGKNFRIARGFHKNQKKESLINEEDAEELSMEQGDLIHILDGLNEGVFNNTMAIGQAKSETSEALVNELKNYTSCFSLSGDGGINVTNALNNLTKLKKEKETKLRELDHKRKIKAAGIEKEMEYIQSDLVKKRNQQDEYISLHKSRENLLKEKKDLDHKNKKRKIVISNLIVLFMILASMLWIKPALLRALIVIFGLIIIIIYDKITLKTLKGESEKVQDNDGRLNQLFGAISELKEDIQDKEVLLSNMNELLKEVNADTFLISGLKEEICALEMAYEKILAASLQLQKEISAQINTRASKILSFLTDEKYRDIRIDSDIATRLNTKDKIIYKEQVSKGTKDEIHFAVRMAFLELFFPNEKMPVILDDAFVMYDNNRLKRVLKYLADTKRQVFLLSCHTREEQFMKQMEIPFHKILLSNGE